MGWLSEGAGAGAFLFSSGSAATCSAIGGRLVKRLLTGLQPTQEENRFSDVVPPHLIR